MQCVFQDASNFIIAERSAPEDHGEGLHVGRQLTPPNVRSAELVSVGGFLGSPRVVLSGRVMTRRGRGRAVQFSQVSARAYSIGKHDLFGLSAT